MKMVISTATGGYAAVSIMGGVVHPVLGAPEVLVNLLPTLQADRTQRRLADLRRLASRAKPRPTGDATLTGGTRPLRTGLGKVVIHG